MTKASSWSPSLSDLLTPNGSDEESMWKPHGGGLDT